MTTSNHFLTTINEPFSRVSQLANEITINDFFLRSQGINSYDISYISRTFGKINHKFFTSKKPLFKRFFSYPPLAEEWPVVEIFYTSDSQVIVVTKHVCKNWEIFFEDFESNIIRGWIRKEKLFCIRPFNLSFDNIACTYDLSLGIPRYDVETNRPKDGTIASSFNIYTSLIPKNSYAEIIANYQYKDQSEDLIQAKIFSGHVNASNRNLLGALSVQKISKSENFNPPRLGKKKRSIIVLMPIYDGYEETLEAISSFSRYFSGVSNDLKIRFILGLDNPANYKLNYRINLLYGDHPLFTILTNKKNLGYVGNCNKLFTHVAQDEDILLVNSDIICPDSDWIERLIEWLDLDLTIGTVTPLSNKATIYSFPMPNQSQGLIDFLTINQIDELLKTSAKQNDFYIVETPSCHGFCTLIAHSEIGLKYLFDSNFGYGYCEENDLSCRLKEDGFLNIAAPNVYVYHHESVSFSSRKSALVEQNLGKLWQKHPNYQQLVALFCNLDPIRGMRNNAILQYLKKLCINSKSTLHISHWRGGGTDKYIYDYTISHKNYVHIGIKPSKSKKGFVELFLVNHNKKGTAIQILASFTETEFFYMSESIVTTCNIEKVLLHSMIDFLPYGNLSHSWVILSRSARLIGIIHDYHWINTSFNLLNNDNKYIPNPWDQVICDIFINENNDVNKGISHNMVNRNHFVQEIFDKMSSIIFPAKSPLNILSTGININSDIIKIVPHDQTDHVFYGCLLSSPPQILVSTARPLNVVVIGAIGPNKGYFLLLKLLQYIQKQDLPIRIFIIGYSIDDATLLSAGCISISGAYSEEEFSQKVLKYKADCSLFLSQWPETYSYTLSLAFRHKIYPFVLDIGAQAERVTQTGFGTILHDSTPEYISRSLINIRSKAANQARKKVS